MARRIPRSLTGPVVVERHDQEDGTITYEIWDHAGATYHRLCSINDDDNEFAKAEAEFMALAINNAIGALMAIDKAEAS